MGLNTYVNFNGAIIRSDKAILGADNRSFRYGDGLFETIRVAGDRLVLGDFHFERLLAGAALLQFKLPSFFTVEKLTSQILDLCKKNGHKRLSRVRLVIFRGDGGLYDPQNHFPNYIIQSWPLPGENERLNENGLVIGLFPDGRKSCDRLANLKSNNYLLYVLAALYAGQRQLNDCLVLNSQGRIADSTISNLFWCRDGEIYTPPLSDGCVAGVMRRWLLETLPKAGLPVQEKETSPEDLEGAEEVFLTNAIHPIRWVKAFRGASFGTRLATAIFNGHLPDTR
ncbi:MAG TPA: aminotransferase class IV [Puia sp.]|nr:aminotransferase class IV [Puia sp.]